MDEKQEFQLRRRAMRLWLKDTPAKIILDKVHRSRYWLSKWQRRFEQHGTAGLHSQSRRPQQTPRACSARWQRLIVQTRRRLVKQTVGLVGPGSIRRALHHQGLGQPVPSLSTIQRVLKAHGLIATPSQVRPAYFPKPLLTLAGVLHAMDWTCRYLDGGPKVYAFHTLNLRTRACFQSINTDKCRNTVIGHCLNTWKSLGIPDFLQLDNDAAFCGGYKVPRVFGQVVRLGLYLGIELIFLPIAEPECNGEIEAFNGLWGGSAFWRRHHFASVGHVVRASPAFVQWYLTDSTPPALNGWTPQQAQRHELKRRLTTSQIAHLPEPLPITAGRIHFIRKVKPDGTIAVLNETWNVSRRLAGKYVWVTIITHCRRLEIWYQRSINHDWRLLKTRAYAIPETIARLRPEFAHSKMAR